MKNIDVQIVGVEWVHSVWPEVVDFIENALKEGLGEYTIDNIRAELASGIQHLFVAVRDKKIIGCGTIKLANTQCHRIAYVTSYGGRGITSVDVFGEVEKWCLSMGATKIQAYAKEAQMRLYRKALGFSVPCYVVEKNYA